MPVPAFRFDKDLYHKLCREKKSNGEEIAAPDQEPDVVFEMGPIDGELGRYNTKTGRITIDVLEHFLICMHEGPMSLDRLKQRFDDRFTETLAHEGGHWHLDKRVGFWPKLEKLMIYILLLSIGFGIGLVLLSSYTNFIIGVLIPISWASHVALGIVVAILTTILYLWALLKMVPFYFSFWMAVSAAITYKVCWHERYARQFAKRTETDPRWEGVVEVD